MARKEEEEEDGAFVVHGINKLGSRALRFCDCAEICRIIQGGPT